MQIIFSSYFLLPKSSRSFAYVVVRLLHTRLHDVKGSAKLNQVCLTLALGGSMLHNSVLRPECDGITLQLTEFFRPWFLFHPASVSITLLLSMACACRYARVPNLSLSVVVQTRHERYPNCEQSKTSCSIQMLKSY